MWDVFISFSEADKSTALTIERDLKTLGLTVFPFQKVDPGDNLADILYNGIQQSKNLVVLVSPQSVRNDWVNREIGLAMGFDDKRIVPVSLSGDFSELPFSLRHLASLDLSKPDNYDSAIAKLAAALRPDHPPKEKVAEARERLNKLEQSHILREQTIQVEQKALLEARFRNAYVRSLVNVALWILAAFVIGLATSGFSFGSEFSVNTFIIGLGGGAMGMAAIESFRNFLRLSSFRKHRSDQLIPTGPDRSDSRSRVDE